MTVYDFGRPFIPQSELRAYTTIDTAEAIRCGETVRATELSNVEYKMRFARFGEQNNMKPPPSCGRVFMGYLVVRKLGTRQQYETWMPGHVFEELYQVVSG